jgi:hypothetical protein
LSYWIEDCSGWLYRQPAKVEQMTGPMMERLLAIIADTEASQERTIAKMDAHQKRMEASMNAWRNNMKTRQETTEAGLETDQERVEAEIKTCLVEVEATELEANPKEKWGVDEQQEVPLWLQ